ncbi:MAG TPA: hypothetical protein VGV14_19510 [Rhodanobacter sp.]|nr:hypothetical protein [Rhodanobacter sp.]
MTTQGDDFNRARQQTPCNPVTYKVVAWVRALMLLLAVFGGGGWTYMTFHPGYADGQFTAVPSTLIVINVFGVVLLAYFVWWAFSAAIVLYPDRFEQRKPFVNRVLRLDQIKGRMASQRGGYPMIVPRVGFAFSLDTTAYGLDDRFDAWWRRLPDARTVAGEEEMQRASGDPTLGATPAERVATNVQRKKVFGAVFAGAIFVSLAVFFIGLMSEALKPTIVVAAVLPWCVITLCHFYKDQVVVSRGFNALTIVGIPLMMPALLLGILALDQSDLLDSHAVLGWGVLVGLPLLFAAVAVTDVRSVPWQQKLPGWLCVAFLSWMHGAGLLALGNRLLDQRPPQIYQTQVVGKHIIRGRGGPTHILELAGWGPESQGTNLRVSSAKYYEAQPHDVVCMGLYPGKFGYPWVHSTKCPAVDTLGPG